MKKTELKDDDDGQTAYDKEVELKETEEDRAFIASDGTSSS